MSKIKQTKNEFELMSIERKSGLISEEDGQN